MHPCCHLIDIDAHVILPVQFSVISTNEILRKPGKIKKYWNENIFICLCSKRIQMIKKDAAINGYMYLHYRKNMGHYLKREK